MDKNKNPVKASAWYTICSIIQKGVGLFLVPIYVRLMTTEQYGTYTLFQSWTGIVLIFTTLNLAAYAFNNCLIKNEGRKDYVTGVFLGLVCILTAATCIIFIAFWGWWEWIFRMSGKYVIALAFDSFFYVAIDLWYARQRFDYNYQVVVAVTLAITFLNLIIGIICVTQAEDKAFAAIVVKIFVQGFITLVLAISIWNKGKAVFDKELWKYALSFNIPLIPHFLSTRILQQADRIMIEKYCGLSDAGIYGFSYKISESMLIFNSAFLSSLIPWTYRKLKEQKYADIHSKAMATIVLIGTLNLILILLAPEAVKILGTAEYYEAMYVIPPIACSCYLMYLFNVFVTVTYYYEQNKLVVLASIVAAALNIVLNVVFIPRYGYLAAGYTTCASYACLSVMHAFMSRYSMKKKGINDTVYNMKSLRAFSIFLVAVGCGSVMLYQFMLVRFCIVATIMICIFIKKEYVLSLLGRKYKGEDD